MQECTIDPLTRPASELAARIFATLDPLLAQRRPDWLLIADVLTGRPFSSFAPRAAHPAIA